MENTIKPVDCIVCGKSFESSMRDCDNMPSNGLVFQARGNYGSTVFDPGDGSFLEINICDGCVVEHRDSILYGRPRQISTVDLSLWDGKIG